MKTTLNATMLMSYIILATIQISQAQPTTLDPGFGHGGILESPNTAANEPQATYGILELSDGYYLGIGHKQFVGFDFRATLMKYDICGVPDSSFGTNGLSIINSPSGRRLLSTAAQVLPDGKILVSGASNSGGAVSTWRPTLFRLMSDGSIDSSYGNNGEILLQPGGVSSGNFGNMIKIAGDTLIGAIGRFPNINGGSSGVGLMRILPDGTPDVEFGAGGIRIYSYPNMGYSFAEWEQIHHVNDTTYILTRAESPDGGASYRAVVYAYDLDGNVLESFGTNGRVQHPTSLRNIGSRGIQSIIDSEGRLVIATSDNISGGAKNIVFTRYLIDGTLDTTFGDNGTAIVPNTAPTFFGIESRTIEADADGGIIASYISNDGGGIVRSFFIRLDGDGIPIAGSQTTLPFHNTGITGLIQIDEYRWLAQAYGSGAMQYQSQLRLSTNPIILPSIEETGNNLTANGSGPDFQWFLEGETIPDATEAQLTPNATGVYTVQMTDALGCQHISDAFELSELSVAENQTARLKLLKNPVEGQLMLQNDLGDMNFEIYNLLGQRVSSGQLINGFNTINVFGLNQGIYLLRTVNEDLSHMKRFMKL